MASKYARAFASETRPFFWLPFLVAANAELDIEYSERSDAWDNFVKNINESVNSLDLEFRHTQDEISGRSMYALVSNMA
jgi:hypothetical protein